VILPVFCMMPQQNENIGKIQNLIRTRIKTGAVYTRALKHNRAEKVPDFWHPLFYYIFPPCNSFDGRDYVMVNSVCLKELPPLLWVQDSRNFIRLQTLTNCNVSMPTCSGSRARSINPPVLPVCGYI